MSLPTINIVISGLSVSGDMVAHAPIMIRPSSSDRIGEARFALYNRRKDYSRLGTSGAPTVEISINDILVFTGTIEKTDKMISANQGTIAAITAYDYGQELLNLVSPDSRTSGEMGMPNRIGMDLVKWVSGVNLSSGAVVGNLMAQFFGVLSASGGSSISGGISFKPTLSGITWRTWWNSGANNNNYYIRELQAKHEYAYDTLRKITRQGNVLDTQGNRAALEAYIGVSGDINIFTSGDALPFVASGRAFIYYEPDASGSVTNNIISAQAPYDTSNLKNSVFMWFPTWAYFPVNQDEWTDLLHYSGNCWSGNAATGAGVSLSGTTPYQVDRTGRIAIQGFASGAATTNPNQIQLIFQFASGLYASGSTVDIARFNSGGMGVYLEAWFRLSGFGGDPTSVRMLLNRAMYDVDGNFIIKSGDGTDNRVGGFFGGLEVNGRWFHKTDTIFFPGGAFNSGNGRDGGWLSSATFPVMSGINRMHFSFGEIGAPGAGAQFTQKQLTIDQLHLRFGYDFSPMNASNSGSFGLYRRRYAVVDYPYQVTELHASGIITHDLQSRMASRPVAEVVVKDTETQLNTRPGQILIFDSPTLGTGSGQQYHFWKILEMEHSFDTQQGFITAYKLTPWFSGTLVDPASNLIDYAVAVGPRMAPPSRRFEWLNWLTSWIG